MKISVISFDLGHNCLGRAYLLAKVLQRNYEVEIFGSHFPLHGNRIWKPCDTGEFNYRAFKGCNFPEYLASMQAMLRSLDGDVIYACKLRFPSFSLGLLKKVLNFKPLVLDIDDLETSWFTENDWKLPKKQLLADPIGALHTRLAENFVWGANDITTVSSFLQKKFGGVIVPHGKDTDSMDPSKFNREKLREEFGLENTKVIMFLGTPRPHKGLEEVVQAIKKIKSHDIKFIIIGKGSDASFEKRLIELGGDKVILMEMIPFRDVPKFLSVADLVVLPQRKLIQAEGQIPAKVFDAMAMAKPIIATNVSDLHGILDGCGLIVEPGDIDGMIQKIEWVFDFPIEAQNLGLKARQKCIENYSWDLMEERLCSVFDKYK